MDTSIGPNGQDRETAQVFAGIRIPWVRAGAQYLYQKRKSGTAEADTDIDIVSAFGVIDPIREKLSLFVRVDWVNDPLPGADAHRLLAYRPGLEVYVLPGGNRVVSATRSCV